MTVRWKPLLVLSGVFLMTAIAGVTTIALVLMNSSSRDILPKARAELQAGEFERAWIQYRRALQSDPKNAAIHEEVADMFARWGESAPADKQADLRQQRLASLIDAARYGTRLVAPRRQLLAEALHDNEIGEAIRWAKELVALAPDDLEAHYVLAREALTQSPPAADAASKHIQALEAAEADRPRTAWLRAWLARETRDEATLAAILEQARKVDPARVVDPIDRLAQLRLLGFDVQQAAEIGPDDLAGRIPAFQAMARRIADEPEAVPGRIDELGELVAQARSALMTAAGKADKDGREPLENLAKGLDQVVEATYKKALESQRPDLRVYETYANFLIDRGQFDECLQVALQALKLPAASQPAFRAPAMALREVAIRAILGNTRDADRFDKAAPHIKAMLASTAAREQAIGHLFHGAICLEKTGLTGTEGVAKPANDAEKESLRAEALEHLRPAAAELTQVPAAQALYGITLILSREPTLGRQYLQAARRAGVLEAKYQIWAAWSMIQAGYPEEAQPIVAALRKDLGAALAAENEGTLRMLEGEIAQARRNPDDLKKARDEFEKALEANPDQAALELKLAQVDIQLKNYDAALERIDGLRQAGKSTASAEQMAVVALETAGRNQEARELLRKARDRYPDSGDLANLDAAIKLRAEQNEEADAVLADYLAKHPDDSNVANIRAAVLNEKLKKPEDAILRAQAERARTSSPGCSWPSSNWPKKNYAAMAQAIAQIHSRWKEAAAADLLDAQLAAASAGDYGARQGPRRRGTKKRTRTTRSPSFGRPRSTRRSAPAAIPRGSTRTSSATRRSRNWTRACRWRRPPSGPWPTKAMDHVAKPTRPSAASATCSATTARPATRP
ncbi:MAG: tetratricopeptide repeat protein [Isosphaeraceae bacterium]